MKTNELEYNYAILLSLALFIYIPLNTNLDIMELSILSTVTMVIPIVLLGVLAALIRYESFFPFLISKVPLSLFFIILGSLMIILQSYILKTATYVPAEYLYTHNVFWGVYTISGLLLAYYFREWTAFFKNSFWTPVIGFLLAGFFSALFISLYGLDAVLSRNIFDEYEINYQVLADYIVISSFLLLARYYKSSTVFTLIIVANIVILFLLASRSAVVFYLAAIFLFFIVDRKAKQVFLILLLGATFYYFIYDILLEFYSGDIRAMSMLSTTIEGDGSLQERADMLATNFRNIDKVWFTGNIYGEFLLTRQGAYIHSYLSYLQNFGIIPFLLLNIIFVRVSYLLIKHRQDSFEYRFVFLAFFFTLFSMLFSRAYVAIYFLLFVIIAEYFANRLKEQSQLEEKV